MIKSEIRQTADCLRPVVAGDSTSVTVGMPVVPDGQDWFWVKEWQSAECQADADLAAARLATYDTRAECLDRLDNSSRLVPTGRERWALMNETNRWGEVGQQKPVLKGVE